MNRAYLHAQFTEHIAEDVLPRAVEEAFAGREPGME
jgi:hypothetical protein